LSVSPRSRQPATTCVLRETVRSHVSARSLIARSRNPRRRQKATPSEAKRSEGRTEPPPASAFDVLRLPPAKQLADTGLCVIAEPAPCNAGERRCSAESRGLTRERRGRRWLRARLTAGSVRC
jgi:hypothetical protein